MDGSGGGRPGDDGYGEGGGEGGGDSRDGGWPAFAERACDVFKSLLTVYILFYRRGSKCMLTTVQRTISQITGGVPFDKRTLELLRRIHPELVTFRDAKLGEENEKGHEIDDETGMGRAGIEIVLRFDRDPEIAVLLNSNEGKAEAGSGRKAPAKRRRQTVPEINQSGMKRIADTVLEVFQKRARRFASVQRTQSRIAKPPDFHNLPEERASEGRSGRGKKGSSSSSSSSGALLQAPWDGSKRVTASNFLEYVKTCEFYKNQLVNATRVPANPALYGELTAPAVPEGVRQALNGLGIARLYSHQVQGINALMRPRANRHVICTTPTSSGKSLIYTVPLVARLLEDPAARAFLLFPTKALAHDQLKSLRGFCARAGLPGPDTAVASFDGDTGRCERGAVRRTARIVVTNPDILHCTVLPAHEDWKPFLGGMRFLVVDEAHAYTGAFGNHVSLVIRRLLRLCHHYGAAPKVVCCSATIPNAVKHMAALTGVADGEIVEVNEDGAPRGAREFGFWNPPSLAAVNSNSSSSSNNNNRKPLDGKAGRRQLTQRRRKRRRPPLLVERSKNLDEKPTFARRSPYTEAACLLAELVRHRLRAIVFVKARHVAELVLRRTRERLPRQLRPCVASYRSGYLASQRRELEAGMASGSLYGMVATNALELGIDIGSLDATLHVGFPGTKSSFLQQAGRAGRGTRDAVSVLIAMDCPLDQFLVHHPERLFRRSFRSAVADPENAQQLSHHLAAAAWERPLDENKDLLYFGPKFPRVARILAARGQLRAFQESGSGSSNCSSSENDGNRLRYSFRCEADASPARLMGIRDVSEESVRLIDKRSGHVLETMDADAAPFKLYDGAVYMHQGKTYIVQMLDMESGVCLMACEDVSYYTEPRHHTRVAVLGADRCYSLHGADKKQEDSIVVATGGVNVAHRFYGYIRRSSRDSKILERVDMNHLQPVEYTTKAVWIHLPQNLVQELWRKGFAYSDETLHAVEHVLVSLCPLVITCDALDLQGQCTRRENDPCRKLLLLYERQKGGIGVVSQVLKTVKDARTFFRMARDHVDNCPCEKGCPACIHHPRCLDHNANLDKRSAAGLLDLMVRLSE